MTQALLDVQDLVTDIQTREGCTRVVDRVSLNVAQGEIVGLVGESGSGKSMTAFSIINLFPTPAASVVGGRILFQGRDLAREHDPRDVRGAHIGMVFQDPSSYLDPVVTVGRQVAETLRSHGRGQGAEQRAIELFDQLGLPDPVQLVRRYPHELSGGQRQRVLIAAAIAMNPALLIADEPTTALDVTVQAGILDVLFDLRERLGLSVLLITHDLGVVAEVCDRVYVMYAGKIVETNTVAGLFAAPKHPYTQGLLRSVASQELFAIPGFVPNLHQPPTGCRFHPRCPLAQERCLAQEPPLDAGVACWRSAEAASSDIWRSQEAPV